MFGRIRKLEARIDQLSRELDRLNGELKRETSVYVIERGKAFWEMHGKDIPVTEAVLMLARHVGVEFDYEPDHVSIKPAIIAKKAR